MNDKDMGGVELPEWAKAGSRSAQAYAKICGAEYVLDHERYFEHIDPRLDSTKIIFDDKWDEYDNILSIDLDMLISTRENIFDVDIGDVAMVHELGVHTGGPGGWMQNVMDKPLYARGIIAYGKHLFGKEWMFPKSVLYPNERFRYKEYIPRIHTGGDFEGLEQKEFCSALYHQFWLDTGKTEGRMEHVGFA